MDRTAPEHALLLAALQTGSSSRCAAVLETSAEEIDWTRLIETAYAHGVTGPLCAALLAAPADLVPGEMTGAAAEHLRLREAGNRALADRLLEALDALAEAGIPAIPFKGPTLALGAFGNLALRDFRDLDFLIREAQVDHCLAVLDRLGYVQDWHGSPRQWRAFVRYSGQEIVFGHGTALEPHWAFAPRTLAIGIDYPGWWARRVGRDFLGRTIDQLAPEDELTALCVHGCKEKWNKLKWVADVAAYLGRHPGLDWEVLLERAERQGIARIVALALELSRSLLDASMPAPVETWCRRDRIAPTWARGIAADFFRLREAERSVFALSRFHWTMRERWQDRWRYASRTLTQPRIQHFENLPLPDRAFFLYAPFKVVHDYLALPLWKLVRRRQRASGLTRPHLED